MLFSKITLILWHVESPPIVCFLNTHTISFRTQFTVYVSLLDNNGESPLLDSRFPDVSGKGRGYQLQAYNDGDREDWPSLRKVSIWQTVNALEQVKTFDLQRL